MRQLERLQGLRIADMRAHAHVDVFALLVERDAGIFGKIADMLDLVLLVAVLHQLDRFGARQLEDAELQVLLADLLHLVFDDGKIFFGDFLIAEVDIVEESVVGSGAVSEIRLGIQPFDCLGHDMRSGVAQDMHLFLGWAFGHMPIVVKNLHYYLSSDRYPYMDFDISTVPPHRMP